MGSSLMNRPVQCFYVIFIISVMMSLHSVKCVELDVGGDIGWATPPSKNQQLYNDWASNNRFKVNDTLRFLYKKDSVMVVTEEEYEKCRSTHPVFFSNNGDNLFRLDRPGLFYFISGVSGHCEKGLNMIIKVLEPESPPVPTEREESAATATAAAVTSLPVFLLVGSIFV